MALSDRDIIITPNRGASTEPTILFRGADATSSASINLKVYNAGTVGTLSFEGSSGQLLSITDSMSGSIFSVNDISGIPSIEVFDTGEVRLAQYNGYVDILNSTPATSTNTGALQVVGGVGIGGDLYVGGTIYGIASVSGTISTATNIAGGAVRQILYQTGVGTTGFITAPATAGHVLTWNGGSFVWAVPGSANAVTITTAARTTNAAHYLTFVDSNNASATAETLYTTSSLVVNPSTGNVGISVPSPTTRLHVRETGAIISGGNAVNGTSMKGIMVDNSSNGDESVGIWFSTGPGTHWSGISGQRTASASTWGTHLSFYTHDDTTTNVTSAFERMRITSAGGIAFGGAANYGSSGQILQSNGNASPTWVNASGIGAGTAQDATYLVTFDDRIKAPSDDAAGRVRFGFTSLANNGSPPYADYLHLRSYTDSSGGNDNLVMFNKSNIGMRIWQHSWGSATAYSSYKDVALETNNVTFNSLGIGTAASGTAGEIRASNEITAYYSSDIRLKENIRLIADPIGIINQIRGVYYDWTDDHIKARGGEDGYFVRKHDIGVIAQEVEKVLPEIVAERDDGTKVVKYEKLIPLLIEAVKEQQKTIETLTSEIKEIKEFLLSLKNN